MKKQGKFQRILCALACVADMWSLAHTLPARAQDSALDRVSSGRVPSRIQSPDRSSAKDKGQRLENIQFKSPAGWKAVEPNANSRIFVAPDSAPGKETNILLLRGPEFQGNFRTAFDRSISSVTQGRMIINKLDVQSSRTSEGYEVLSQALVSEDKQGQRTAALYVAINMSGRLVAAGFVAPDQELFTRYLPVMTKFLADMNLPTTDAASRGNNGQTSAPSRPPVQTRTPQEVAQDEDRRRKPGKVTGNIYDAQGRPFAIPGTAVHIHVWGVTAAGERAFFDGDADARGRYEIPVVHGLYAVTCTAKMPLGSSLLSVDLEVLDGRRPSNKEDSTPGICKDFGLRLTGPIFEGAPGTYHGGYVTLTDGGAYHSLFDALSRRYPAGTVVRLTLTPRSRVIDGSPAAPIVLDYSLGPMQTGQTMGGIPLALYTATARIITPNGQQKPLRIGLFPGSQYGGSVDVVFTPEPVLHGQAGTPSLMVTE